MSAMTLSNGAWKNVLDVRRRACVTLRTIGKGFGASTAPVGISCGFQRESIQLGEMDK